MKRSVLVLTIFFAGILADASVSHAQTFLMPPGGVTVKDLHVRTDGWVIVTFAEAIPEISGCGTWAAGQVSYSPFLFLDLGTGTGKQVYGSLLAASLTGRKLKAVVLNIGGTNNCYLLHANVGS